MSAPCWSWVLVTNYPSCPKLHKLGFYHGPTSLWFASVMSLPKPGDNVKVTLMSGETIEGVVEWIDGAGAWVKGTQKNRWVPLEAFQPGQKTDDSKDDE